MSKPSHHILNDDFCTSRQSRLFPGNAVFDNPGALKRYEAGQDGETYMYIRAPCHEAQGSSGAVAAHSGSVLIAVDGGCRRNGQPNSLAACSIYFSPSSSYNRAKVLPADRVTPTSQRAELTGRIMALEAAKRLMLPRMLMPKGKVPGLKQIVIKADSEYLVRGAAEWISKWKRNQWKNSRGAPVANRDLFETLDNDIKELEDGDVLVQFWHVPREQNQEADSLANEALDKREKGIRETNRQAKIFVLCLEEVPLFNEMYAGFWNTLEDYAQVQQETDARSALDYLGAHRPDKILVVDPEVANKRKHQALLSKLKEYVSSGGTVIFCCIFSSFISPPELTAFFRTHFELPWESGSYQRLTARINQIAAAKVPSPARLPALSNQKALHLKNVAHEARLYEPFDGWDSQRTETPAAWTKIGQGWIGYVGDINNEEATVQIILGMCGL